jgi:hypothetical protein
MAITDKYGFETISYSNTGWNGLLTTFIQKVEAYLWSRLYEQLGEPVSAGDALYLDTDGKMYQAQANGTKMPMLGIAVEAGVANDYIRIQRAGKIVNTGWSLTTGGKVWLSTFTAGAITQVEPNAGYIQLIGMAMSPTVILLTGDIRTEYSGTSATTTTTV